MDSMSIHEKGQRDGLNEVQHAILQIDVYVFVYQICIEVGWLKSTHSSTSSSSLLDIYLWYTDLGSPHQ